ncbi:MAG: pentapeptide repeat-containing protein [Bacillota bacterium]
MGDSTHISKIREGVAAWNDWRRANPDIQPNLTRADLAGMDLTEVDLRGAGLFKANLSGTKLVRANLRQARIVETNLQNARLSGAHVYGTSVWDVDLRGAEQSDLVITPPNASATITVDDLEVAQFLYLLIRNEKLRRVIDTITSKVVLILGRFRPERKAILDSVRDGLRKHNYLPVLFDFAGPDSRDFTETVATIAHLSRFVIADLTDPACIPHELRTIVPDIELPVATIIERGHQPYAMFGDLGKYPWLLAPVEYVDQPDAAQRVLQTVIEAAERKRSEILR